MKCKACDSVLSDLESTRKNNKLKEYEDLCGDCMALVIEDLEGITGSEDIEDLDGKEKHDYLQRMQEEIQSD